MASENTHIYLADQIRQKIPDGVLKKVIADHMDAFFLGSVFPDILFYSKEPDVNAIASRLHGEDGQSTNTIIFKILDKARVDKDHHNFAFAAGILTHYAVDMTFHPMIFYFAGEDPDAKHIDVDQSAYRHMHYETTVDLQINDTFYIDKVIQTKTLNDIGIYRWLGVEKKVVDKALRRQILYYRLTRSRWYYYLFRALSRLGWFPARAIAGFHANVTRDKTRLPSRLQYRDVVTGEPKTSTISELVEAAVQFGNRLVAAAYAYYTNQIGRGEAELIIAGQSLETGRVGTKASDIRFYADLK